jgi:hypothetical protein
VPEQYGGTSSFISKTNCSRVSLGASSFSISEYRKRKEWDEMSKIVATLFVIGFSYTLLGQQQEKQASTQQRESAAETQTQEYLATFEKDGVPTLGAVKAALAKAKAENTIETWASAARLANSYSNVVDVLSEHYLEVYQNLLKKTSESSLTRDLEPRLLTMFSETLGKYDSTRNEYRAVRNECYLSVAELYLAQGNKASALSYAMTAVELTGGDGSIQRGEALIKKIIEYE